MSTRHFIYICVCMFSYISYNNRRLIQIFRGPAISVVLVFKVSACLYKGKPAKTGQLSHYRVNREQNKPHTSETCSHYELKMKADGTAVELRCWGGCKGVPRYLTGLCGCSVCAGEPVTASEAVLGPRVPGAAGGGTCSCRWAESVSAPPSAS